MRKAFFAKKKKKVSKQFNDISYHYTFDLRELGMALHKNKKWVEHIGIKNKCIDHLSIGLNRRAYRSKAMSAMGP